MAKATVPAVRTAGFYVCVRDGKGRTALLAGPFAERGLAAEQIDPAERAILPEIEWARFYDYGTCRVSVAGLGLGFMELPGGWANRLLGLPGGPQVGGAYRPGDYVWRERGGCGGLGVCHDPRHDHVDYEAAGETPRPLACTDCRRPSHYNVQRERYFHDEPGHECFVVHGDD